MTRALPALLGATLLAGCSSGPPRREIRRYPVLTYRQGFVKVKETARISMRAARFPIEVLSDAGFEGPEVRDRGFSWKFSVALGRGTGYVSVSPTLEIARDREVRPVRGALRNMGRMGLEDQESTAMRSNPDAYSRDREAMDRASPGPEREAAIARIEDRVRAFIRRLEGELGGGDP